MDTISAHGEDSERQVLAAAMQKGNLKHAADLGSADFYSARNRDIFKAMRELEALGKPLSLDYLTDHLTKDDRENAPSGMKSYLSTLFAEDVLEFNLPGCVAYIKNKAIERELRTWHLKSAQSGGIEDLSTHLNEGQEMLARLAALPSVDIRPVKDNLDEINRRILDEGTKPVETFSARLNRNLNGGLQRKKMLALVTPAGHGKTTIALQLIEETVRAQSEKSPCIGIYIAMEMAVEELITKSYSRLASIDSSYIEGKRTVEHPGAKENLVEAMELYRKRYAPMMYFVEAKPGMTYHDVRSITHKIIIQIERRDGIKPFVILCVDPFQRLCTGSREIDSDEMARVGEISSGLKKLARDLDVSVIMLSDTTKDAAKKADEGQRGGGTAPRGSYMITHVTDLLAEIITLPRSLSRLKKCKQMLEEAGESGDYYKKLMEDFPLADFDYETEPVYALLDFSKNRSGTSRRCPFVWQKAYNRFIPIGSEQIEYDGGSVNSWRERWNIAKAEQPISRNKGMGRRSRSEKA